MRADESSDCSIMHPKISILMAVYNAAEYLRESIGSVCSQTMTKWELIAIDDASTDESLAILQQYAVRDDRIHVISMPRNGGQAKARNAGLAVASGVYICFVDSDDRLAPDALQKIVERFETTPEADSVLFRLVFWHEGNHMEDYPMPSTYEESGRAAFEDSLTWNIHGVYAVRAEIHRRYPYDTSSHAYSDDNTTRLHFLASRKVVASDAIYYYRQHAQSVTHRIDGRRFDFLLANESMKRQLLALKVDDALISLYENERWKNLVDVGLFYYLHHQQLSPADRKRGWHILHATWRSIEPYRIRPSLKRKLGYMPLRFSWPLFCFQETAYFFLRGLLGKNQGK